MVEIAYHPDGSIAKIATSSIGLLKAARRWVPELEHLYIEKEVYESENERLRGLRQKGSENAEKLAKQLAATRSALKSERGSRAKLVSSAASDAVDKANARATASQKELEETTARLAETIEELREEAAKLDDEASHWRRVAVQILETPTPEYMAERMKELLSARKTIKRLQEELELEQAKSEQLAPISLAS
jgi:septal ring factor EnvC (AmiA/AmiB activator)